MARYLYYVLLVLAVIIMGLFFYGIRGIFSPFIFAIIIAYMLYPLLEFLQKWGFSRLGSLILLYFALAGLVFITTTELIPLVFNELQAVSDELPKYTKQVQELYWKLSQEYARVEMPQSMRQVFDDAINRGEEYLINMISVILENILSVFSYLPRLAIAPILAFYLLKDMTSLKGMVVNSIPYRYRGDILSLLGELDRVLSGFVRGHILISLAVGVVSAISLYFVGVDFAILIGIIAGITNVIPYFGPILGAIPAIFMASLKSPVTVIYVIIIFVVIQQLESNILAPTIIGDRVGLPPLAVISALLVGAELFGFLGLLLAVPLAAILKVLCNWFWYRLKGSSPGEE
jgi:predicted PurR-regulated permease PerM